MDALIAAFNAIAYAVLALATAWAVLNPRINDGVVIKAGLIFMALGFSATAVALADGQTCSDLHVLGRAELLIHSGLLVVGLGFAWRIRDGRRRRRRVTDWGLFDDGSARGGGT